MSKVNSIKSVINLFVTKTGATSYVTKPQTISIFKSDLQNLKYVGDTFEKRAKSITVEEVKKLFPTGKLDENNYLMREIKDLLGRIKTPRKIVDLSPDLTEKDYRLITDMMNLHGGKYIDVWKGFSDTDLIPNIQKLALFNRTMRLTKQAKEFIEFDVNKWDVVVDGIIRKPKEALTPLLEYKVNSKEINEALSDATKMTPKIQKKVDAISKYLDAYVVKKDFTAYRGDKSFYILPTIKINHENVKLDTFLEKITQKLQNLYQNKQYHESSIKDFVDVYLKGQIIEQPRFMSIGMTESAIKEYAKKIKWNITIPAGTKGTSIESFNIERLNEAEFLGQKGGRFKIKDATYKPKEDLWYFDAVLEQ